MKVICHRESMLSALQCVSGAIATKDVKPILRNVKAIVADDRVTLMATDLELGIRLEMLGVKVEEIGDAMLPFAKLVRILRESPDEEMTIELTDAQRVVVRGERGKWDLPTDDASAFPDVPEFNTDAHHEIKGGLLRDMIGKTTFAAASTSRFASSGILCEAVNTELAMVATDGGMLSKMHGDAMPTGGQTTEGKQVILPVKFLDMVSKNIADPDELVRICLQANDALVKTERATIYTRLIEGRFPNYKLAIPAKFKFKASLIIGPFAVAIRQAAIATDAESIRVRFAFDKGKLTIRAGSQAGESVVELPVECDGKFNADFKPVDLSKMLSKLEPDSVIVFEGNDANGPCRMTQGNYLFVAMPLFVKE